MKMKIAKNWKLEPGFGHELLYKNKWKQDKSYVMSETEKCGTWNLLSKLMKLDI